MNPNNYQEGVPAHTIGMFRESLNFTNERPTKDANTFPKSKYFDLDSKRNVHL